jgi:hypothetical protein
MDNEDDEWVEVLKRLGLEGKHFEAKGVSRGEFQALKRFGDHKQLVGFPLSPRGRQALPLLRGARHCR